jgi:hypothetical protein
MVRSVALLALIAVMLVAGGCAKSEYVPARGQVYYNDKPLATGVVMFQPSDGPPARGTIQTDGTFELTTPGRAAGARIGNNRVRIASREVHPEAGEVALGRNLIPERYNDFVTSGLTAEVKPTDNDPFVFRLKD